MKYLHYVKINEMSLVFYLVAARRQYCVNFNINEVSWGYECRCYYYVSQKDEDVVNIYGRNLACDFESSVGKINFEMITE